MPELDLKSGEKLSDVEIAYETYGKLNSKLDNALIVLHGTTSTHHAAGDITLDRRRGWWDSIIGPGKLFDTGQYFIVSANMLGSSYGSTGPASTNPATGRPYGKSFPEICIEDIVDTQYALLRSLGIDKIVAVAGQAIGGLLAFQWAVRYPEYMAGVIATDCGPKNLFLNENSLPKLVNQLSAGPDWNNGNYYDSGGVKDAMTALRVSTLRSYQFMDKLKDVTGTQQKELILRSTAREWAEEFDANSLIVLTHALAIFDVEADLEKIRARIFYVLADTDELYPADIGADAVLKLRKAGVDVTYIEVKSRLGHYATTEEPEKWIYAAEKFLSAL